MKDLLSSDSCMVSVLGHLRTRKGIQNTQLAHDVASQTLLTCVTDPVEPLPLVEKNTLKFQPHWESAL